MRVSSRRFALAAILAASLFSIPASATTLIRLSEHELVEQANLIVLGEIESVETLWADPDQDGISQIYTSVTLQIEKRFKGVVSSDRLSFRVFGGKRDGVEHKIPGIPPFQPGEKVLLFLRTGHVLSELVGLGQGKFSVRAGPNGRPWTRQVLDHANFVEIHGRRIVPDPKGGAALEQSLEALEVKIQDALRTQGGAGR